MVKRIACLLAFGPAALAQGEEATMVVNLEGLRYPTIANVWNVQGEVGFEISPAAPRLITGNPILVLVARRNLDTGMLPPLEEGRYLVWFHFKLAGEMRQLTFPVGSKGRRFFLRLIGAPTKKVEAQPVCERDPKTSVRQALSRDDNDVIIDVFVDSPYHCAIVD
jgi:hypothetical protein